MSCEFDDLLTSDEIDRRIVEIGGKKYSLRQKNGKYFYTNSETGEILKTSFGNEIIDVYHNSKREIDGIIVIGVKILKNGEEEKINIDEETKNEVEIIGDKVKYLLSNIGKTKN